jgi:hypothetical protein
MESGKRASARRYQRRRGLSVGVRRTPRGLGWRIRCRRDDARPKVCRKEGGVSIQSPSNKLR